MHNEIITYPAFLACLEALGGVALGTAGIDILRRGKGQGGLYYDTFLPNIIYTTQKNADGGVDLLVYNALSPLANLLFGDNSAFTQKKYDPVTGEEIPNAPPLSLGKTGVQTIKNFDMANASTQAVQGSGITNSLFSGFNAAFLAGHGDLNMVFRDRSALAVIALLQNAVKGVPIVQSHSAPAAQAANDNEPNAWPERAFHLNASCG